MIPLAKDTREAIGAFADKVENRSLLFEKMVLSKNWGHPARFNDANRFNVLRACSGGTDLLHEDAESARRKASSPRAKEHVKEQAAYRAQVAGSLASVKADNSALARRQVENANHLLRLLEKSYSGRSRTFVASLGGRLLVNMAGGVQENAGLSLDRCFGLPLIPGSAAKGVARSAALWEIRNTTDSEAKKTKLRHALLAFGFIGGDIAAKGRKEGDFVWAAGGGEQGEQLVKEALGPLAKHDAFKGVVSFLPATPSSEPQIVAEVLTPHPRAREAASGRGDPHPIFFPAVETGTEFGFAVVAPAMPEEISPKEINDVLDAAAAWLQAAVTADGIGAKTGAGYGWFVIDPEAEKKRRAKMEEQAKKEKDEAERKRKEAEAKAAEQARLEAMTPEQRMAEEIGNLSQQEFAEFAKTLGEKSEPEQKAFLGVLASKAKRDTRRRWKRKKADLWSSIVEIAEKHNITLP